MRCSKKLVFSQYHSFFFISQLKELNEIFCACCFIKKSHSLPTYSFPFIQEVCDFWHSKIVNNPNYSGIIIYLSKRNDQHTSCIRYKTSSDHLILYTLFFLLNSFKLLKVIIFRVLNSIKHCLSSTYT